MIKIVALNDGEEEPNEDEDNVVSREAQETIAESEYIRAIKLKSEGEVDLCFQLLQELLETQVLNENLNNKRNQKLWIIKYNCHKNIALILEDRSDYIQALQHYISAILIDSTDVSTLYRFGQLALKMQATDLAEYAFENCLKRNSAHWCAAEGMLQVMNTNHNIIGSYSCATKIFQQNVNSENAEQTLKEISNLFRQNLSFLQSCSGFDTSPLSINKSEQFKCLLSEDSKLSGNEDTTSFNKAPDLTKFYIEKADWCSIGQFIVSVYSYLQGIEHNMFFTFKLNDVIGKKNEVILPELGKEMTLAGSSKVDSLQDGNALDLDCIKTNEVIMDNSKVTTSEKSDVQPMDFNNDDSDSNLKSDGVETNKAKPRRRCSDLHFLEQWGWHKNRRYSSRKKNERDDVDTSLNGYLNKVFTKYTNIPLEDKWPFGTASGNNTSSYAVCMDCQEKISEELFNSKTKIEFEKFNEKLKDKPIDLMHLSYKWLKYLSLSWSLRIPESLAALYVEIFKIYNCHFSCTTWNQLNPSNYEASYRLSLLYLELSARDYITDKSFCEIWRNVYNNLIFNIGNCNIISASNFEIYQLKLIYLEYLLLNKDHQYNDCLTCLKQMSEILEKQDKSFLLHLPNLDKMCINIDFIQNLQLKFKRQIDINNIPKLYEEKLWNKLTEIIIANIESTENQYENDCWLKDFCAQIEILLQSFWIMTSYESCLIWSEKCFHFAVTHYLQQETKTSNRGSLLADIINFVTSYIEAIILNEGFHFVVTLKNDNLCRLVQNAIRLLVYQFDGTFEKNSSHGRELNFKRPWVILHQLILRDENDNLSTFHTKSDEMQDITELIPKSFLILFTAHEHLGKRQWCTKDNGEFLLYVLDAVVLNLKAPVYDVCRDIIYEYIEQVTYCLFKYPQKKARLRHLEDHEANQIELSWPNAVQIFDLYRPEDLPEFNSYKLESITSDMEQLLLKVIFLMPKELDPSKSIHHVTMFIEGRMETPPRDSEAFKLPYKILSLYYLLADFYFKSRDFAKAIKYYTLDLTVSPTRFDSWAGMALSKASKIETKLNGLDPISMETIWEECEEVLRCFECCINLNRFQTLLWIEYGSFSYTIHSCFSRYIKRNSKNISEETLSTITGRKNKMLTIAYNCFSLATSLQNSSTGKCDDDSDSNDEKWLCQYMLGKISEKRKEEPKVYLNHYLLAANYLYESSATYPIKINHSNPTTLSVEALEVFYRINAAIIKCLHNEKEISRSTGELFNKVLKSLSSSAFAYNKAKIDGNSLNILKGKPSNKSKQPINTGAKQNENLAVDTKTPATDSQKNSDITQHEQTREIENNLKPAAKDCNLPTTSAIAASSTSTSVISSDTSSAGSESDSDDSLTDNENNLSTKRGGAFTAEELKVVYRMVVQNIEECVTRFPEHYKSIYRLIFHYMNSPAEYRNLDLSEKLLLGQYKTSLGNLVNGLFYDRKNNNLFNGIWRIPSSEIDRPGSFSAHLVKCVKIFIELLFATKNYSILVDLAINLYKTPDLDKRYITDAERKELCQESLNCSIKVLRSVLEKNMEKRNDTDTLKLLIDIYKIHKKCVKYMNQKEPMIAEILIDVYKFFIKDKVEYIPDNCNFLDLAIKLCVQEITLQKNMEKSLQSDGNTNVLDTNAVQTMENQLTSRVIHIPGLNTRPKNRGNTLKNLPTTAANTPISNPLNMFQADFLKNSQALSMKGSGTQPAEKDNPGFHRLFEEIYSKMLQNELKTSAATSLFPQNPLNFITSQATLNFSNPLLMLPFSTAVSSTSEASTYAHSLSTDESNSLLKQHTKTKSSDKSKATFKPYNRPAFSGNNQNISNDNNSYKTEILSNSASALSAYSNLFNTALSQIDLTSKNPLVSSSVLRDHIPETTTSYADTKDFQNSATSYKSMMSQAASQGRLPSASQMRAQFSSQQPISSQKINSPTKTLQEKLAERQKAYQLSESNSVSDFSSSKDKSCDDVIVLD